MICQIVDVVRDNNNSLCIIMEKYNRSLEDIIKDEKIETLSEKNVLRIFTMICIPIYHIHKINIVHRDLKPANILVKNIGDKEIYSLTDFGTAFNPNSNFIITTREIMSMRYASYE
jgi:serine/threonine protein kinase